MHRFLPFLALGLAFSAQISAQSCTGLCLKQLPANSCSQGVTSTISGTVFAPNGTDPLTGVTVYIPNDTVGALPDGVQCTQPGDIPSGSPLLGTTTNTDGTFTLTNVPIGTNIPIVILTGKWRRQTTIDTSAGACKNTLADPSTTRMPRNASEGDIPKIAIATGDADPVECVLRKVGISDSEFQNPGGAGRIQFYLAEGTTTGQSGSYAGMLGTTPSASVLMQDINTLKSYDVLMLPCEGADNRTLRQTQSVNDATSELKNLVTYANVGGRVYASHYSYDWLDQAQSFGKGVVNWNPNQTQPQNDPQNAIVDQTFADGQTLATWLTLPSVNASTTLGQMQLGTLRHDLDSVIAPTQSWLTLNNDPTAGKAVMQFTFDLPLGKTSGQCGRILFNEYHVETAANTPAGHAFPTECSTSAVMTPQEKLLEFMLFNLTSSGGDPKLTPATADFGSQPVGFTSAAQTFTWTNTSIFSSGITLLSTTGDFGIVGANPCTVVAAGASCSFQVSFTPSALGSRTGTLIVGGDGKTLRETLTGTGTPAITVSPTSMNFGNLDVTASTSQSFTLTNIASGSVPVPSTSLTGDFSTSGQTCGSSLTPGARCTITVAFRPTATGARTGVLTFNSAYTDATINLSGNGVDFALALSSASDSVIAGRAVTTKLLPTPIAGYSSTVSFTCTTTTPGATCALSSSTLVPANGASATVTIQTTSQYTVVGYSGLGGRGLLLLAAAGSVWMLRRNRKSANAFLKSGLAVVLLGAGTLVMTGCGNLAPAQNNNPTGPGSYTFTLTGTDGILTHSTTYNLAVTTK